MEYTVIPLRYGGYFTYDREEALKLLCDHNAGQALFRMLEKAVNNPPSETLLKALNRNYIREYFEKYGERPEDQWKKIPDSTWEGIFYTIFAPEEMADFLLESLGISKELFPLIEMDEKAYERILAQMSIGSRCIKPGSHITVAKKEKDGEALHFTDYFFDGDLIPSSARFQKRDLCLDWESGDPFAKISRYDRFESAWSDIIIKDPEGACRAVWEKSYVLPAAAREHIKAAVPSDPKGVLEKVLAGCGLEPDLTPAVPEDAKGLACVYSALIGILSPYIEGTLLMTSFGHICGFRVRDGVLAGQVPCVLDRKAPDGESTPTLYYTGGRDVEWTELEEKPVSRPARPSSGFPYRFPGPGYTWGCSYTDENGHGHSVGASFSGSW